MYVLFVYLRTRNSFRLFIYFIFIFNICIIERLYCIYIYVLYKHTQVRTSVLASK